MRLPLQVAVLLGLAWAAWAGPQLHPRPPVDQDANPPNLKNQQEEMLKADHQKDLQDAARLIELTQQLKQELEKNDRHVLSVTSLKKTEEIEKLAKRIRSRLRRF